jgi:hypothetical protein
VDGSFLDIVNGVCITSDEVLGIADAGNDRICAIDLKNRKEKSVGQKGIGKYKFKEPVGIFSSGRQGFFVADWHNHRCVEFNKKLKYLDEFGVYKSYDDSKVTNMYRRLRHAAYKGRYQRYHFKNDKYNLSSEYSLKLLAEYIKYRVVKNISTNSFTNNTCKNIALNKPNGVETSKKHIYITQKNNRCVTIIRRDDLSKHRVKFRPSNKYRFGRLGNIKKGMNNKIYICDEENDVIWVTNKDLGLINIVVGGNSGVGSFSPFSCARISKNILAVTGGKKFQLIETNSNDVLYKSNNIGELHGIDYDIQSNRLYIANRAKSRVEVYTLK